MASAVAVLTIVARSGDVRRARARARIAAPVHHGTNVVTFTVPASTPEASAASNQMRRSDGVAFGLVAR